MPERTLTQVVNELQQVRAKLTDLKTQTESQQAKARELAEELSGMVSDTLPSGYRMEIRAGNGLSVAPTRRRSAKPAAEGPTTKELRAWAADKNWTVPEGEHTGKSISTWKNRIPEDVLQQLRAAYSS